MKTNQLLTLCLLAVSVLATNTYAMGSRGGGWGGGWGRGVELGWGGCGCGSQTVDQNANTPFKYDMPPAVKLATLETSSFDNRTWEPELSDSQQSKIYDLKSKINDTLGNLYKRQAEARAHYTKAKTDKAIAIAVQEVLYAVSMCKSYNPNKEFESELATILNTSQRTQYAAPAQKLAKNDRQPVAFLKLPNINEE